MRKFTQHKELLSTAYLRAFTVAIIMSVTLASAANAVLIEEVEPKEKLAEVSSFKLPLTELLSCPDLGPLITRHLPVPAIKEVRLTSKELRQTLTRKLIVDIIAEALAIIDADKFQEGDFVTSLVSCYNAGRTLALIYPDHVDERISSLKKLKKILSRKGYSYPRPPKKYCAIGEHFQTLEVDGNIKKIANL